MAAYDSLKSLVQQAIRTNGNNEITGQVLQNVLMAMIDELGGENGYAGVATPSTNPGAPDGKVFYFATEAGTYTHFDGATLAKGIHLLVFNGVTWSHQTLYTIDSEVTSGSNNLITSGAVYTKIINAINALDATVSKSAGADGLSLSLTEVDGKVTNISGSIAPQTYDAYGAASAAQIAASTDATNKVNAAKTQILGDAASDYNTLGKLEDKIQAEASRAAAAESALNTEKADKATTLAGYGINDAYTKTEVNGLVSTPHQNYVTVPTYASLPATGSADTIYRVSNYNGSTSQVDASVYSEYAWNGSGYTFLRVVSQIGEVFDITVYNSNTKYADLAAALGANGANVPSSIRRGGMSVKFVQSSDNKYVQARCKTQSFSVNPGDWSNIEELVPEIGVFANNTKYTADTVLFTKNEVSVGDIIFYQFTVVSGRARIELRDDNGNLLIESLSSTTVGQTLFGTLTIPSNFSYATTKASLKDVFVRTRLSNKLLDKRVASISSEVGVFASNTEYTSDVVLFTSDDVVVGDIIYYKFKVVSGRARIEFCDENGTVLATSLYSSTAGTVIESYIEVPTNFAYAITRASLIISYIKTKISNNLIYENCERTFNYIKGISPSLFQGSINEHGEVKPATNMVSFGPIFTDGFETNISIKNNYSISIFYGDTPSSITGNTGWLKNEDGIYEVPSCKYFAVNIIGGINRPIINITDDIRAKYYFNSNRKEFQHIENNIQKNTDSIGYLIRDVNYDYETFDIVILTSSDISERAKIAYEFTVVSGRARIEFCDSDGNMLAETSYSSTVGAVVSGEMIIPVGFSYAITRGKMFVNYITTDKTNSALRDDLDYLTNVVNGLDLSSKNKEDYIAWYYNVELQSINNIFTNYVNTLAIGKDVESYALSLKQTGDTLSHDSTMVIDNVNEVAYIVCTTDTTGTHADAPDAAKTITRLYKVDISTRNAYSVIDVKTVVAPGNTYGSITLGDTYGTGVPNMIMDTNRVLHILTNVMLSGETDVWNIMHISYDVDNDTFLDYELCTFDYNGNNYQMTNNNIGNLFYNGAGTSSHKYFMNPNSTMAFDGTYYYLSIGNHGLWGPAPIMRTTDFTDWEFVFIPNLTYTPRINFEQALAFYKGYFYLAMRQDFEHVNGDTRSDKSRTTMVLAKISTDYQTVEQCYIPDDGSRPAFFFNKRELYLIHSIKGRKIGDILKIDDYCLTHSLVISQVPDFCQYPTLQSVEKTVALHSPGDIVGPPDVTLFTANDVQVGDTVIYDFKVISGRARIEFCDSNNNVLLSSEYSSVTGARCYGYMIIPTGFAYATSRASLTLNELSKDISDGLMCYAGTKGGHLWITNFKLNQFTQDAVDSKFLTLLNI